MTKKPSDSAKLTIIGCGDAFASGGRFNTCFYIHYSDTEFLVDCGASSLIALKKLEISTNTISAIILSHLHGDHYGGIPFLLLDAQYVQGRKEPLHIIGPTGTAQKVKELTSLLYPGIDVETLNFKVNFSEYTSYKKVDFGILEIMPYPVIHSEEALPHGLRIKMDKKVFSFSGDTEWTENLIDIAHEADLFICESNFYDKKGPNHLDYQTLLPNTKKFNCKRIILNHLGEEMIRRSKELEIDCAFDGQEIFF